MNLPAGRFTPWLMALLLGASMLLAARTQAQPAIAAASDLSFALQEVAAAFERGTGQRLKLVFGSSGNFTTQILQGAPFQMFLSADEELVFNLADAGKTMDRGRLYALGRLVIMVPTGSPLAADGQLKDLAAALQDGRVRKFAIANPDHAPYGARAREALQSAGLWQAIEPKLVLGENVSQAAQFATSGSAQGGIIALSLARAPEVAALGSFALIPAGWHKPLRQRAVLLKGATAPVRAFFDYLATPAAQGVMVRYGFTLAPE